MTLWQTIKNALGIKTKSSNSTENKEVISAPVAEKPAEIKVAPEMKPSMSQLQVAYQIAKTQMGLKESSGGNHNSKIVEYHQSTTLQATDDETAWCSSFVNWCLIVAGMILNPSLMQTILHKLKYEEKDILAFKKSALELLKGPFSQWPTAGAMIYMINENSNSGVKVVIGTRSAMARSWLTWGKKTTKPRKGDLVCFKRGNNGYSGHIAFYQGEGMTFIDCLGGNQNNSVCEKAYSKLDLLGYITLEEA